MYFSPSKAAFYQPDWKGAYEVAGSWPADAIAVTEEEFIEFSAQPDDGFVLGASSEGRPAWVNAPKPTRSQQLEVIEQQRANLLAQAETMIADWKVELMLDVISDEDKVSLTAWMAYKRDVKSVAAEDALSSEFSWPVTPMD